MNRIRLAMSAAVLAGAVALAGCVATPGSQALESDGPPAPTPTVTPKVIVETNGLQGDEITIAVGEAMAIDAEGNPDAYRALVIDASIAEFYAGTRDGLQPTIVGVAPGETQVVIGDPSGESDDISFNLVVTE